MQKLSLQKQPGVWFLFLLCTGFLFAEIINDRFWLSDLEVYYRTAVRLLQGKNLYRYIEDGHYVFKYSPVSAAFFIPLTLFPFFAAKIIYWLFLSILLVMMYVKVPLSANAELYNYSKKKEVNYILFFGGVIMAVHFLRELHLGQVNMLLLVVYLLALSLLHQNKNIAFGSLMAASVYIKPFGLIFLPWLIYRKNYKAAGWVLIWALLFFFLPVIFYREGTLFLSQYHQWINELIIELGNKQGLMQMANHTLFSVIARYTPAGYLLTENILSPQLYQLILLAIAGLYILIYLKLKFQDIREDQNVLYDSAMLIAFIPLLSFTSENAFIFALPMVLIILSHFRTLPLYLQILTVIALLMLGGNFSELTGKKLSQLLDNWSVLSVGNILLTIVLFNLRRIKTNARG